jgi:hypothetical protein
MKFARRDVLQLAIGGASIPVLPTIATAQAYPTRPITVILPVPPGGGTDAIARMLAEHMRTSLGQPLIVESVTGAGGSLAVTRHQVSARRLHRQYGQLAKPCGHGRDLSGQIRCFERFGAGCTGSCIGTQPRSCGSVARRSWQLSVAPRPHPYSKLPPAADAESVQN